MSIRSSVENYKIAKSIYFDVDDNFYEIENADSQDEEYIIDQTLDSIKKLNRHINRINLEELESEYDERTIETVKNNIDTFKEASYFIERSLISMKLFDKLHPVLSKYMEGVEWKKVDKNFDEANKKVGRFLTSEDNYQTYRTIITNIIRGSMNKKAFEKLFDSISSRILKPKKETSGYRNPLPPQMWSEKDKKKWEEEMKKRSKSGVKDQKIEFDNLGEWFLSLKEYKELFESLAFYCATCGERAEHEEIEDNPNLVCSNCGDSNWVQEY